MALMLCCIFCLLSSHCGHRKAFASSGFDDDDMVIVLPQQQRLLQQDETLRHLGRDPLVSNARKYPAQATAVAAALEV